MEKLLHERLRESQKGQSWLTVRPYGDEFIMWRQDAERLADEIERYYIPRPRFEDGEPVQFGDRFTNHRGEGQTATSFTYTKGEGEYVSVNGSFRQNLKEPVARPTPKVYDADEVEIKVGESLYNPQGYIFEVRSIEGDEDEWLVWCGETKCGIKVCYKADECTHERPVFDAEGVRICKGDTVWGTMLHDKHEVSLVKNGCVYLDDGSICFEPTQLTHREPDSIKRILEDMGQFADTFHDRKGWMDGFKGIMERLARYEKGCE